MYVTRDFKKALAALTVRRPFMHLDRRGAVVIGIGHAVESLEAARALPLHPYDPDVQGPASPASPASMEEIDRCWSALMACRENGQYGAEFLPDFYREGAPVLTEAEEERLLEEDVAALLMPVREALPGFDRYPQAARELLVELALHVEGGAGFLREERWAALREALLAEDWEGVERLLSGPGPGDEPGRLGEERRRWRAERLKRAREIAAAEANIDEKVDLLMQSLGTLADTARTEMKKIEAQVGELADELVSKARDFLKDLGARMAEVNLEEAIQKDLARRAAGDGAPAREQAEPEAGSGSNPGPGPGEASAGPEDRAPAVEGAPAGRSAPDDHVV